MKAIIIDRDSLSSDLLRSRLSKVGHEIIEEPVKNDALDLVRNEPTDVVYLDPAPLAKAEPIIHGLRRASDDYIYIILASEELSQAEAYRAGANLLLRKPLNSEDVEKSIKNAGQMLSLVGRMGDTSEDFASAGGVIAKSAFNQLFLSALERAARYGEQTFLLRIYVDNYQDIFVHDGPYAADFSVAKLSQNIVQLRRQSDIIGQTGKAEYTLLLQRPQYETEPFEAVDRFAASLSESGDITSAGLSEVVVSVELVDLPAGECHVRHEISFER